MTPENVARRYFELSNRADLESIEHLLANNAIYSSDQTGLYYQKQPIMKMMQGFYDQYQSLNWSIDKLEISKRQKQIVEIEFTCHSITKTGIHHDRVGIERLIVVDNHIQHIEVRTHTK